MLRLQAQELYGVRIAAKQERDDFVECIDHGVGVFVHVLVELGQANQIRFAVQCNSPDVDVAGFDVGAVGVAAGQAQENHMPAQVLIGLYEAVFCLL